MLADESTVNAIMGTSTLEVLYAYEKLDDWPAGDTYSRPECMAVNGNAMEAVYRGSPYHDVRGTVLADSDPEHPRDVDEAVVAFETVAQAQDFVAATVAVWRQCADTVLTITSADRPPRRFRLSNLRTVNGIDVIDINSIASPDWGGSHAMHAIDNIVIDVRVADYGLTDQAVRLVNSIAGRNRL